IALDLSALAVEVAEIGVRLGQPRGVKVYVKEVAPVTVVGDGRALRRAMLNLVENAVKYTPAGGSVAIALAREGPWAVIAVTDTGPGIDPADRARVFEPFVRLDTARARETGGTGLGLAIAHAIVVAHGGTLGVDSTLGAGSTFTIRLPLSAEPGT